MTETSETTENSTFFSLSLCSLCWFSSIFTRPVWICDVTPWLACHDLSIQSLQQCWDETKPRKFVSIFLGKQSAFTLTDLRKQSHFCRRKCCYLAIGQVSSVLMKMDWYSSSVSSPSDSSSMMIASFFLLAHGRIRKMWKHPHWLAQRL